MQSCSIVHVVCEMGCVHPLLLAPRADGEPLEVAVDRGRPRGGLPPDALRHIGDRTCEKQCQCMSVRQAVCVIELDLKVSGRLCGGGGGGRRERVDRGTKGAALVEEIDRWGEHEIVQRRAVHLRNLGVHRLHDIIRVGEFPPRRQLRLAPTRPALDLVDPE
jgi:hypothetical protein